MSKKFLLLTIAVLLFSAWSFSQTGDFDHEIGVSLKASTNGIGGDIYYRPAKKLTVKAGVEYLSLNLSSDRIERFIDEDVNVTIPNQYGDEIVFNTEGNIKTGALSVAVGYQPFKMFYLTAGLGKSLFASDVRGISANDIVFRDNNDSRVASIAKDDIGPFVIDIKYKNSITPYFGIGLGSFVPQNSRLSFALELGAYYIGNFNIEPTFPSGFNIENIQYSGEPTQSQKDIINGEVTRVNNEIRTEVNKNVADINDALKSFKFYPVLKLTVGFRAFTFKK